MNKTDIGRHAARSLFQLRGPHAIYDVDKCFRAGQPEEIAVVMIEFLLKTYNLAPPDLPERQRTGHWRKKLSNCKNDVGGSCCGIEIPGHSESLSGDASLDWMDEVYWLNDDEILVTEPSEDKVDQDTIGHFARMMLNSNVSSSGFNMGVQADMRS